MMRKVSVALLVLASAATLAQPAAAQGYGAGYMDIGPTVGFGSVGSASMAFGGRFEKALKPVPSLGNGMLGIQVGVQYYSWSAGFGYSVKYIPISVTANYHFKMADSKIDPFLGLGLGYNVVTCSGYSGISCGWNSGIYFAGRAGVRYFFAPKLALYADAGTGGPALNIGVMFKMK